MGAIDKTIRILIAGGIGVVWAFGFLPGLLGYTLLALAGVFLLTSMVGVCPLYMPFGFSTKR